MGPPSASPFAVKTAPTSPHLTWANDTTLECAPSTDYRATHGASYPAFPGRPVLLFHPAHRPNHRHQRRPPSGQRFDDLDDFRGACALPVRLRSEERSVGKEGVTACSSGGYPDR